jgi:hypothetical protein
MPQGTIVRKNGKAYDSADVVVQLLGSMESEVSEITYYTDREHQLNHSLGRFATSWSMGKEMPQEANITLSMNATAKLEKMAKASGGRTILDLAPFDINVSFINEFNEPVNDTISCKFQSTGRQIDGGMNLKYQHKLFVLDIDYNNL